MFAVHEFGSMQRAGENFCLRALMFVLAMQPIQSACILCSRRQKIMLRGLGLIRTVSFLLFTPYIASCQAGLPQHFTSELPLRDQSSLPDAPSPAPPQTSRAEKCCSLAGIAREPFRCACFTQNTEQPFVPAQLALVSPMLLLQKSLKPALFL